MPSSSLHIHFATMTGNAEALATDAHERAEQEGWSSILHNLADVSPADLSDQRLALFVVSTWGDGEPPDDANAFWFALEEAALDLRGLHYAVFGLGDIDYPEFNAFGRNLDDRLTALGATRLLPRVEAGLDFDTPYLPWADQVFAQLATLREGAVVNG
mgnify:FL=1